MSTTIQTKNSIHLTITLANQFHYGSRDSGSSIVDSGIQRRKKFNGNQFQEEIAIFGLSLKGLLRELAYEICKVGLFPFPAKKDKFTPQTLKEADPNHPFYSIFGCIDCHGKIRVSHGTIQEPINELEQIVEKRTSIRIEPTLQSTAHRALFTYETCNIRTINYIIEINNPTEEEIILLLATLNRLEGKIIAGRGSTGAGIIIESQFDKTSFAPYEQKLKDLVTKLKKGGI